MNKFFFYNIAFFLFLAARVQASVYATRPVRGTVFMAGQPAMVSWIEDGRKPLLEEMNRLRIDLFAHDTLVATLAKNVPAASRSRTIFIPTWIPSDVPFFNMRFITTSPHSISYTADFSILGGTGDPIYPLSTDEDDDPTVDGDPQDPNGTTDPNPNDPQDPNAPTITDPNSPGYKDPNAAPNSNNTTTTAAGPPPPASTIIAPPLGKGDIGSSTPTPTPNSGLGSGTSRLPYSAAARSGADLETLKFRTAFILWPAVIGISMAL